MYQCSLTVTLQFSVATTSNSLANIPDHKWCDHIRVLNGDDFSARRRPNPDLYCQNITGMRILFFLGSNRDRSSAGVEIRSGLRHLIDIHITLGIKSEKSLLMLICAVANHHHHSKDRWHMICIDVIEVA